MATTPARRLFQVRQALEVLHLDAADRYALGELADNLERKIRKSPIAAAGYPRPVPSSGIYVAAVVLSAP